MSKVHYNKSSFFRSFIRSFVFLFFCFSVFLFAACGNPDPVNSPDGGQEDGGQVATDGGMNDGGPATADGGVDGGLPANDGGQDAGVDGGDPLAEYMWIQGSWQETLFCATVQEDGGMSNCQNSNRQPEQISVVSWDENLGAEVRGFNPMGKIYVKKNTETQEYVINITYTADGGFCTGKADRETLKISMYYKSRSTSEEIYVEWEKQ